VAQVVSKPGRNDTRRLIRREQGATRRILRRELEFDVANLVQDLLTKGSRGEVQLLLATFEMTPS
jgi:hypothetical protein